jgi:hypothetical protein
MNATLGIMSLTPETISSYYQGMGEKSIEYNIDLYLFSPHDISPTNEIVEGYYFHKEKMEWCKEAFKIPEFIYDRTFYTKDFTSKQAKAIVQWLKNKPEIAFLGYGLPDKWRQYQTLKVSPLSSYIVSTELVESGKQLLEVLVKEKDLIMKPIDGAHGFAVYHLSITTDEIVVRTTKKNNVIHRPFKYKSAFIQWVDQLIKNHTFIVQKRLTNLTNDGRPFDLRVLLQKDQNGNWYTVERGIRLGAKDGILTNISAGSTVIPVNKWKKEFSHFQWDYIETELDEILELMPSLLEKEFAPLFEIGIDFIISEDNSLWILDMNSKPGRKLVQSLSPHKLDALYHAPLKYCEHLFTTRYSTIDRGDF